MAHRKRFPACTHCGGQSEDSRASTTFSANDGELPGWDIKCGWCGKHFLAVMIPLPAHASMSALDDGLRERRRNDARRRRGYHATSGRGAPRYESDTIMARVRILPGRVSSILLSRLGPADQSRLVIGQGETICFSCRSRPERSGGLCYQCMKQEMPA